MERSKQSAMALIVFVALFLVWGCGSSAPSRKGTRSHARGRTGETAAGGSVAERTRVETHNKRGGWSLTSEKVSEVVPIVSEAAGKNGVPEDLIYGVIWVESRFNPKAVSNVGARGMMQLMPLTAEYLADCIDWKGRPDPFDPNFNISAGSYYISKLIDEFHGDEDLALAAYNAGPTKVRRWMRDGGLPEVSIEYATMVQTARSFFGKRRASGERSGAVTNDDLDRLGLAILIAGLNNQDFGTQRENDPNPFD